MKKIRIPNAESIKLHCPNGAVKIMLSGRSHAQADYWCKLIVDKLTNRAYRMDYNCVIIPGGVTTQKEDCVEVEVYEDCDF